MSPEDRQVMIRGMVDGLAAKMAENPNDFPGWLRLANAQMVLREPSNAADSLAQALKLQPANVGLLIQFAEVRIAADRGKVGPEAEQALNRAIQRQPGNPQALWRLGQAAAVRGETEKARAMWTEILPKLLEADPLKADVRAALEAL
jgi:cytochrome c-type biogenesis protein CcmH